MAAPERHRASIRVAASPVQSWPRREMSDARSTPHCMLENPYSAAYPARSPLPQEPMEPDSTSVKGAREHTLKGITLRIPKKNLVVSPAVPGAGRAALASDPLPA